MIIRMLPTPLNLHVLFAPWCIPLSEPWPLTPVGHMHLFTLYAIIKATSPMSLIASLVASSNLVCIILYLSIAVLFAGNKSTTTTTTIESHFCLLSCCAVTWRITAEDRIFAQKRVKQLMLTGCYIKKTETLLVTWYYEIYKSLIVKSGL